MLTAHYAKAKTADSLTTHWPGIKFNALEPGATATDRTAAFGIGRPVAESASVVVRFATLGPGGPTGTLQEEAGVLPW